MIKLNVTYLDCSPVGPSLIERRESLSSYPNRDCHQHALLRHQTLLSQNTLKTPVIRAVSWEVSNY